MNARWGLWPRISWNPPDFTLKSGRFYLWNPVDFTQISSVKSTQNYKSKCFSKNSSVWWMQGGGLWPRISWNPPDSHPEIWWIWPVKSSRVHPRFHLWNPPKIIKASVSAKTLQFDECKVGAMTKDFMKSGGFHVKSKDLLQGIVTLCFKHCFTLINTFYGFKAGAHSPLSLID